MDEYITRNNAISTACLGCNQEFSDEPCEPDACAIIQAIMALPLADVVPREEFEALQRRYDLAVTEREANAKALIDANIDLEAMRGAANSYKMHYENLASGIFEELETVMKTRVRRCVNEDGVITPLQDSCWTIEIGDYAQIKKKYTEDGK